MQRCLKIEFRAKEAYQTGDLRERGAVISKALCVIDRQAGGGEKLAAADVALTPLFTITELKEAAGVS